MNFSEYKSAEYWERKRRLGDDIVDVDVKSLAAIILGFVALFVSLWLV